MHGRQPCPNGETRHALNGEAQRDGCSRCRSTRFYALVCRTCGYSTGSRDAKFEMETMLADYRAHVLR